MAYCSNNVIWADTDLPSEYNVIGKRGLMPHGGVEKASGRGLFTRDVKLPGMLYAKFLLCPYAHARIISMDTSAAEALPGVAYVLKYDDPEVVGVPANSVMGAFGRTTGPPVYLLGDTGYWEGEGLGVCVAAVREEICDEALRLIDIEWEELPFVLDSEEALQPGAPLVVETADSNFMFGWQAPTLEHGDIQAGFSEADEIIEFTGTHEYNSETGQEPCSSVARWNSDYHLEVWVHTQVPCYWRGQIARMFGMPYNRVVTHNLYQGSQYGGYNWRNTSNDAMPPLAVILAKRTGRPVKVLWGRKGDFGGGSMDNMQIWWKVGFKNDGTITAVQAHGSFANSGQGPYMHILENTRIPNLSFNCPCAMVDKPPNGASRCEMQPDAFGLTIINNHVAGALGMDPSEVALKNDGCEGEDMHHLSAYKVLHGFPDRDSLAECIVAAKAAVNFDSKWHAPGARKLANGKYHGMGFCWTQEWNDPGINSACGLLLESDGTISIHGQQSDTGLNNRASLAQCAAEVLGVSYDAVAFPDRAMEYCGWHQCPPAGSLAFTMAAWSIKRCAKKLKAMILEYVTQSRVIGAHCTEVPAFFPGKTPDELDIKGGAVFEKADPGNTFTLAAVAMTTSVGGWVAFAGSSPALYAYHWMAAPANPGPTYKHEFLARQCYYVEVEVDPDTGLIETTNVVMVNDVGLVCNYESCEGQQYGGAYMGSARGLCEAYIWDPNTGVQLNSDLETYKLHTVKDIPHDGFSCVLLETGLGFGPWGMLGIGEDIPTLMPFVYGDCLYNALGVWVEDYPITPERVLKALGKA